MHPTRLWASFCTAHDSKEFTEAPCYVAMDLLNSSGIVCPTRILRASGVRRANTLTWALSARACYHMLVTVPYRETAPGSKFPSCCLRGLAEPCSYVQ